LIPFFAVDIVMELPPEVLAVFSSWWWDFVGKDSAGQSLKFLAELTLYGLVELRERQRFCVLDKLLECLEGREINFTSRVG
jgi:hypothetical protein